MRPIARVQTPLAAKAVRLAAVLSLLGTASLLLAQQQPIAFVPTQGVTLSGSLEVANGRASIGNNGTITAGDKTARIQLARGGELALCESTKVHLSTDNTLDQSTHPGDNALMIALDRGAFEAHYTPGPYSDVVMTPDLRILISGPGKADLSLRVGDNGDTCIDNHGANAPYVTVNNLFSGGVYRVQPNQRVLLEHADVDQVVDNEAAPCGCPSAPSLPIASRHNGMPVGGPSSTPADTDFPLAESEGLQPPPPPPSSPVVPVGTPHAEVAVPLIFDGTQSPPSEPATTAAAPADTDAPPAPQPAPRKRGFFHSFGHFFAHLFGRKEHGGKE
jgi:hypothetical protein